MLAPCHEASELPSQVGLLQRAAARAVAARRCIDPRRLVSIIDASRAYITSRQQLSMLREFHIDLAHGAGDEQLDRCFLQLPVR